MILLTQTKNARKSDITIIVCFLLITISIGSIIRASPTISLQNSETLKNETSISKNVNDISEMLHYRFAFKEPHLQDTILYNTIFTKIHMPGTINIGRKAGEPSIPVKLVKLLLPPKTQVTTINVIGEPVEIKTNRTNLKEKPILPYQNPITIGSPAPKDFEFNNRVYASSNKYPSKTHEKQHTGYCRGYTILSVTLNPLQYVPGEGKLSYYPEMTIEIELKETEHMDQLYRNNPDDETWVKKLVYNPEMTECYKKMDMPKTEYFDGLCDPSDNYDYVIITRETLFDFNGPEITYNWTDLINRKQADGLEAIKVKVEDILACSTYWNTTDPLFNDTPALIREFCKDAYQDWGTQYLLIGGDQDGPNAIERRLMDYEYESDVESDLYWSNLHNTFNADHDDDWGEENDSGFDLYSELFIGSIPCDEGIDISNWLTKSFYYEDSKFLDYLENATFYGGNTGWPCEGDDFIDYSAIKGTDDWLGPDPDEHGPYPSWLGFQYGFETWNNKHPDMPFNLSVKWTAEPPNPGWQGGSEEASITGLRNAINNDQCTLISAIAHANAHYSMDVSSYEWEQNYHNTKPFFVHDYGCHCGDMDAADDGVLHSMLFHSDTELAFACVYNTCYGWGSWGDTNASSALQQKLFWDYMFDLTNNSGSTQNWTLGRAMAFSKDEMAPTINWIYGWTPGAWRGVIQGCLLFGDPAQRIKPPSVPNHNVGVISLDIPSHVKSNKTIHINATVFNNGKNDETNVVINLSVNDVQINSTIIPLFKNQSLMEILFVWTPVTAGMYTITINITIPNIIENSYEDNEKGKEVRAGVWNIDTDELFDTIQEVIDDTDTLNGHSILVPLGTYYENVMITKSISLIGEDQDITVVEGIDATDNAMYVNDTSFVTITGFTIQNGSNGVCLRSSDNVVIENNKICGTNTSIQLTGSSSNNTIRDNDINGNNVGITVSSRSDDNHIYHNNFNNTQNAFDAGTDNKWDNGYYEAFQVLHGGNWWSDYNGIDHFSGPEQNISGSDDIGDTPYSISGGNSQDQYPLMEPWTKPAEDAFYVDCYNREGPWDGTPEHPFQHIQDAMNNTDSGDTVFVYDGTYYENVIVTKSINFIGRNKYLTRINGNGNGHVVTLLADGVKINGFTIQNSGSNSAGIYTIMREYNNVSRNIIINNTDGILFFRSRYNTIYENIVANNFNGILLDFISSNNDIRNCEVYNNSDRGICLYEESSNCNITNNNVYNNNNGVYLFASINSNIINCNSFNNSNSGIYFAFSENNNIVNCHAYNNGYGLYLYDSSNNNYISSCNSYNNSLFGIFLGYGSNDNLIFHNNFANNAQNAYDECNNFWYNATLQEGNYWSDYTDLYPDANPSVGDPRIWDTPYDIPGGDNQDVYPFVRQDGWLHPPGDLDGDGDVDLSDLAQLLAHYGMTEGAIYEDGDIDGDGDVDLSDLAALLANYGTESGATWEMGDFDGDGDVDLNDLAELIGNYGYGT